MASHIDYPFQLKDAHAELLSEELLAVGVKGLIAVQTVPTGGAQHIQMPVPANEWKQNPDWKGWLPNPQYEGEGDKLHDPFIPNKEWLFSKETQRERDADTTPSHLLITHKAEDYQIHTTLENKGILVYVRMAEPADNATYTLITQTVEKHNASGLSKRQQAEQAITKERQAAISIAESLKAHDNPDIRALARAVSHLLGNQ